MRSTGTLKSWHDDRGFGFITPAGGGPDVFVHASALAADMAASRPVVGETLFYDSIPGRHDRPRAVGVSRTWAVSAVVRRAARQPRSAGSRPRQDRKRSGLAFMVVVFIGLASLGYDRYVQPSASTLSATPHPMLPAVATLQDRGRATPFRCDGRTSCSQMHSCEEAMLYMDCPDAAMDGDGDGIPCESQWCSGFGSHARSRR